MKHLILTFVVAIGVFHQCASVKDCHMSKFEECMNLMTDHLHSYPKGKFPETEEQLNNFCQVADESTDCLEKYQAKCMTPMQKEILDLVSEGMKTGHKDLCTPGTTIRTNYLTHAACLNDAFKGPVVQENLQYVLAVAEKLFSSPVQERMNVMCCGYKKMYNTIRETTTNTCGEEASAAGEDMLSTTATELPTLLCHSFDEHSEKCLEVLPPEGSKPTEACQSYPLCAFFHDLVKNHLQ